MHLFRINCNEIPHTNFLKAIKNVEPSFVKIEEKLIHSLNIILDRAYPHWLVTGSLNHHREREVKYINISPEAKVKQLFLYKQYDGGYKIEVQMSDKEVYRNLVDNAINLWLP